jgi:aromatic-L-amino-acid decarboxylase
MAENALHTRLQLSRGQMRSLGYRVVDALVEHFERLPSQPVSRVAGRKEMERLLREPLPENGTSPEAVVDQAVRDVFGTMFHPQHPRFFAFVPSPSNFVSVMAEALSTGFNPFAGMWLEAAGPAQVELVVVDWLRQLCGLPESAGGLFVSGGSMANLTALAVARHVRLAGDMRGAVLYTSEQTHSSVEKAGGILGFAADQFRKLPTDEAFRLRTDALAEAVAQDGKGGRRPFCVIASAGTTNTGAVDPLNDLADFCAEHDLWLHVDGAYGAAAVLCEEGRRLLAGLERVDSLSLDPHKWMFQPFETGCVLVRHMDWLKDAFHIFPEYLQDLVPGEGEVNFSDYGVQLTRSFRALKLWMSLKVFGAAAFREAVARGFRLAEFAERELRGRACWEVTSPAQMAVVTFRHVGAGRSDEELDEVNRRLVSDIIDDGYALVTSTLLRGRTVLRLCPINPRTSEDDIRGTIDKLEQLAARIAA